MKPETLNLAKSVEREFSHDRGFTIIVCRFDFESPQFTVAIKQGHYTTFGQFESSKKPTIFRKTVSSKEKAYGIAKDFLTNVLDDEL